MWRARIGARVIALAAWLVWMASGLAHAAPTDRIVTRALQRAGRDKVVRAALRRGFVLHVARTVQHDGHPVTLALSGDSIVVLGMLQQQPKGRISVPIARKARGSSDVLALSEMPAEWSRLSRRDITRTVIEQAKKHLRAHGELGVGDGSALSFAGFIARHPKLMPTFVKAMREHGVVGTQLRTIRSALLGLAGGATSLAMIGYGLYSQAKGDASMSQAHSTMMVMGGFVGGVLGVSGAADSARKWRTAHVVAVSQAMRDTLLEARRRGVALGKLASWL